MTPDDPRHGEYRGWQAHIKTKTPVCEPCAEARRAYQRQRSYDTALGRPRRLNPQPVADHIRHLIANGMTLSQIARTSGVHPHTVEQIWKGTRKKVSADHAGWLLGVTLDPDDMGLIPALGSARRLQALARLGWSAEAIANAAKKRGHALEVGSLKAIRIQRRATVRTKTARGIAAGFEELSMRLPKPGRGVNSLRTRAERAGFLPPLAWANIDDPDERPVVRDTRHRARTDIDHAVVQRVMAGERLPMTISERRAVVHQMQALGWSQKGIEAHTGITKADRYAEPVAS